MIDRLNLFWRCAKCGMDQLGPVGDLPEVGIAVGRNLLAPIGCSLTQRTHRLRIVARLPRMILA